MIETELLLADLDAIAKKLDRVGRLARVGQKEYVAQAEALEKAKDAVEKGTPLRAVDFTDEERDALAELNLITMKPVLFVANVAENDLGTETPLLQKVREGRGGEEGRDRRHLRRARSADRATAAGRARRFPRGDGTRRSRDWTSSSAPPTNCSISRRSSPPARRRRAPGRSIAARRRRRRPARSTATSSAASSAPRRSPTTTTSPSAASRRARAAGKMRSEGKDYVVQDGDVILFRFNVEVSPDE